jgi:transposase
MPRTDVVYVPVGQDRRRPSLSKPGTRRGRRRGTPSSTASLPGSAAVGGWLASRSQAWRNRIELVAIDPSAAFKKAITEQLPDAKVSVDPFHLVQLANLMVTSVRQRLIREGEQRRGAKLTRPGRSEPAAPRLRHRTRLDDVFAVDDPTQELSAAWGVKEQLRRLLHVRQWSRPTERR